MRRIDVRGPSDVRAVAAAVEDMRCRLVEELDASQEREDLLAQQTEELRRSNSELEQFAYVASHDLQEPLRKVASFCQLLDKRYGTELDARGKQYIDFAVDGAKRMQVLINDLLTFSRVGRVHDSWNVVDLEASLDRGLANLALVIEESGTTIVRADPLPGVNGDATTLAMIWQNLIGNAVKFRRPDEPCVITIGCVREEDFWHFTVTDNGIGIAPEFAEKVFVIFQRLHARDEYDGTGIGLALCRKIIEFHGGRIWLDPEPRPGARIHFCLPVDADTSPAAAKPRRDLRRYHVTNPVQPIEVLLVEDDPGDELMTREAFEDNKIRNTLHVVRDGQEALDFLYRRGGYGDAPRPDLILLDLNLPRYDGRQVLEQIKQDPELSLIPVVVLTTSSAEEDILRSYKLHANAYVTKPVDLDQFIAAVRQIDEFFVTVVRLPGRA